MTTSVAAAPHHVVVVGGGFGGLRVVLSLGHAADLRITLVDRRNFHLFQPLLYQVATGALSASNIATPLRALVKKQQNTSVILAEATGLDVRGKVLYLRDGDLAYDTLVVAAGSRHHYFGHPEWEEVAPGLKSIEDATRMRRMILSAFESAERTQDPLERQRFMTFVVVGGGPTAVELAGALAEIAVHTIRGEFRRINQRDVRILVIEASERIISSYPPELSQKAAESLRRLGVEVHTGSRITAVHHDHVQMTSAQGHQRIACACILWAAGVMASPLGQELAAIAGQKPDRSGRVTVNPDCSLPDHPDIFVIGDMANLNDVSGKPLPGLAPVAMQQGDYVAKVIRARLDHRATAAFRYHDRGSMAVIGKRMAVAQIGTWRLAGTVAWLAWAFIHVREIITFENRLLVLIQWAWYYLTWNRNGRLITGPTCPEGDSKPQQTMATNALPDSKQPA